MAEDKANSFLNGVGGAIGGGIQSGLGGAVAGGLGEVLGLIGQSARDKRQLKLQGKLNEQAAETSYYWNERAAQDAYARQKELRDEQREWDQGDVQRLKDKGLSIGLLYGGAGGEGGGQGAGASGPQGGAQGRGGQAPNSIEEQLLRQEMALTGAEVRRVESEVELNKANAKEAKANAEATGEQAETTRGTRDALIEKLKQEGKSHFIENIRKQIENEGYDGGDVVIFGNKLYGGQAISKGSKWDEQTTADIAKAFAEANNNDAASKLTDEKTKGYWNELLNATRHADADVMKAEAIKLATEFNTGEYTNWRTWINVATQVINAIAGLAVAAS